MSGSGKKGVEGDDFDSGEIIIFYLLNQ